MKALTLAIAFSLGFSASGLARIGDDEKQIESIYGKAAKVLAENGNNRQVAYAAGAFAVVVDFVNGISRREGFAKPDASALKPEEIQQILSASAANGTTWKETAGSAGDKKWDRSDKKAVAVFPARGTYLVIQEVAYVQPD